MNKCIWDETGLKPCEMQALDCSSCDYHQEEQSVSKCINCYHYKACAGFGFILDPLHGGVICEDFINAADVMKIKHSIWGESSYNVDEDDLTIPCLACGYDSKERGNFCPNCGAKMDGG